MYDTRKFSLKIPKGNGGSQLRKFNLIHWYLMDNNRTPFGQLLLDSATKAIAQVSSSDQGVDFELFSIR
jgi:hypothetical protein